MRAARRLLILLALLLAYGQLTVLGAGSECGPALYKKVTTALKDADFKAQAQDWIRRFQRADPTLHRGMLKAALHKDVKALREGFRDLPAGANPFGSEDEVYRAISQFTNPNTFEQAVPGLDATVKNIFSGADTAEVGALLELKVADDIVRSVVDPTKVQFQKVTPVPGRGTRSNDVVQLVPGAPPELGGICHESKNWTAGLRGEGANYGPLREYADDNFVDDILLHAQYDWQWYVLDLRGKVKALGEDSIVRAELLKKFDDPVVVEALGGPADAALRRAIFENLWDLGKIARYH